MARKPVVLCILDGWGARIESQNNAIIEANTPFWNFISDNYPNSVLETSGLNVGLPEGQMGNSEVGHMNIGGGRIVLQNLPLIDHSIENDELQKNPRILKLIEHNLEKKGSVCHIMGLLSPGGVHSHQNHILALASILSQNNVNVKIHAFLDGRDTPPKSAKKYVQDFELQIAKIENVEIATLSGRYYAMDRDKNWDRIKLAYDAIVLGAGNKFNSTIDAIDNSYNNDISDEFVLPCVIGDYSGMNNGDSILMANFRSDRARQILSSLVDPQFSGFQKSNIEYSYKLGMVEYSDELNKFIDAVFPMQVMKNTLGEVVSNNNLKQLRIAETEKYAHVTFFFNGGIEKEFSLEERILIPSPNVATYDLKPEMSAFEVTKQLVDVINQNKYDLIVVNYANADMVGHTGVFDAAVKAIEALDSCLKDLVGKVLEKNGSILITADHGNAELMKDINTGQPHTAHTTGPVPFLLVSDNITEGTKLENGKLCDIAPTILDLMGLEQPSEMTGNSLIVNK